jgi:hypothetical protein
MRYYVCSDPNPRDVHPVATKLWTTPAEAIADARSQAESFPGETFFVHAWVESTVIYYAESVVEVNGKYL